MPILTANELVSTTALHRLGAFTSELVTSSGALWWTTSVAASDALASSAEEALHAVEITHILTCGLLRLALAVVNFLMVRLLLQVSAIIAESGLSLTTCSIGLKRLHLGLESIIDTLPLVDRMIEALRARN